MTHLAAFLAVTLGDALLVVLHLWAGLVVVLNLRRLIAAFQARVGG
jgi:NADH:ubiquinone oxidoreductase subunit H